jgi:carbohydrate binding protein with CBM4/9 domain
MGSVRLRRARSRSRRRLGMILPRSAAPVLALALLVTLPPAGAVWSKTTVNPGDSWAASTLQPPTGFSVSNSCPGATVTATWTATTSTYATGYTLVRKSGGTVQNTINVSGRTTTSQNDTSAPNGTYTYELTSVSGGWTSSVASGSTTVSCIALSNPGFETGTLTGWTCTGGSVGVVTSPVHSGTYAIGVVGGGVTTKCSQTVTGLSTNHTYTFSMWGNGSGAVGSVGYTLGGTNSTSGNGGAGWIQSSISFTTGPTDTSVVIYFQTTGTVAFDDAALA